MTDDSTPDLNAEPPDPGRSARDILVEWANHQDAWVRAIVGEVLSARREVPAASVEQAKNMYLVEKQLLTGQVADIPPLGEDIDSDGAAQPLHLVSVRDCHDVNALAADQEIVFNPRMTVLFGENASGKTGYVRVLKRLANVRSAEPIIPDIHRASSAGSPRAQIRYALGDQEEELAWHDESGVAPFTRLSVFDAPAVALHLEDSVTYVYTPADLALFKYAHTAIEGVKSLLEAELVANQPRQNPFISAFTRGSTVYPKIESLAAGTDLVELRDLASVSDTEQAQLEALKVSVEALASASTEGRSEMLRSRRHVLHNLTTIAEAITGFQGAAYESAVGAVASARDDQAQAAATLFTNGQLPDAVHPAWQQFIEASEQYIQASGQTTYPDADERCIYCGQALSEAAVRLITSYRSYAQGLAASSLATAEKQLASITPLVRDPKVAAGIGGLGALLTDIDEGGEAPDWATDGRHLLEHTQTIEQALAARAASIDYGAAQQLAGALLPRLRASQAETDSTIQALEGSAQERAQRLASERTRLINLEARVTLSRLLPEIETFVQRAAWADRLRTLLAGFQSLLRSVTETTKVASAEVLNRDFERLFYNECQALRAPNVTLDFPGRRGEAVRRKTVTAQHSLTEILSESEQKIIALADFLAEASLRTGSAPIIFDDPVTSLDDRRLHEVVRRITDLSQHHQVVVFTHNMWFASELLAVFEGHPADCDYYRVAESAGLKGVVSRASHPRLDTVAKVKGRINKAIHEAASAPEGERTSKVDAAYDHIRTWCETVVEGELLAKVTERHRPNVAMTNLRLIKADRLKEAVDVIMPIFEKACRYMPGHSQPTDTLGVRPTLEELQRDWMDLQQALKRYTTD